MNREKSQQIENLTVAKSRVSIKERITNAKKRYDVFMYKHGRTSADIATDSRRVVGAVEAGFVLVDWRNASRICTVTNAVSDIFDGHAARKHELGGTEDGARRDQQYDKERSFEA